MARTVSLEKDSPSSMSITKGWFSAFWSLFIPNPASSAPEHEAFAALAPPKETNPEEAEVRRASPGGAFAPCPNAAPGGVSDGRGASGLPGAEAEGTAADETEEPGEEAEAKAEAPLDAEEAPVDAEEAGVQVEEAQTEGDTAKDAAGAGDGEDGALHVKITDEPLPALPVKVGDNTHNADYNTPSSAAYQHAHAALHLNCTHSHIRPLYVLMPTCTTATYVPYMS